MDTMFPFGLPGATALYEVLYVLTFVLHLVLAQFVLAGTGCLVVLGFEKPRPDAATESELRDWLPFALGGAITLGVAPLLFLQLLDRRGFYTANLLLRNRYAFVLAALVIGFYMLYVAKSSRRAREGRVLRVVVPLLAFACFVFTGYTWSQNRILSESPDTWVRAFTGPVSFAELLPRFGFFAAAALPSLALVLAASRRDAMSRLANIAWLGFGLELVLAIAYVLARTRPLASGLTGAWVYVAGAAFVIEAAAWGTRRYGTAVAGRFLFLLSIAAIREVYRLGARADVNSQAAAAATKGGMPLFFVFAIVNAALLIYCLRRVVRVSGESAPGSSSEIGS